MYKRQRNPFVCRLLIMMSGLTPGALARMKALPRRALYKILGRAFLLMRGGGAMSEEFNVAEQHRRRATELRGTAVGESHPGLRSHLLQMAAEYERLAISAEALAGIARCERRLASADILPFEPRG